jgi:hypothetical protein
VVTETIVGNVGPMVQAELEMGTMMEEPQLPETSQKALRQRLNDSAFGLLAYQASTRDLNVEELFDIQQQADFFISLGQHDQAIEVLKNHISENVQTSPLVYLDLLSLYHSRDRPAEYKELAADFTKLFNGVVPGFENFEEKTLGLEAYSDLLYCVESLWNTCDVITFIEESIFRNASRQSETLGLEAYRELLLLHSVAKDLAANRDIDLDFMQTGLKLDQSFEALELSKSRGMSDLSTEGSSTSLTDIEVQESRASGSLPLIPESRSSFMLNPAGARIGLDIDLTAYTATLPEVNQVLKSEMSGFTKYETSAPPQSDNVIEFNADTYNDEISRFKLKGKS